MAPNAELAFASASTLDCVPRSRRHASEIATADPEGNPRPASAGISDATFKGGHCASVAPLMQSVHIASPNHPKMPSQRLDAMLVAATLRTTTLWRRQERRRPGPGTRPQPVL
jgi:hypothetical protein